MIGGLFFSLLVGSGNSLYKRSKCDAARKKNDEDPYCSVKSNDWHRDHPEGYQVWFDNYLRN